MFNVVMVFSLDSVLQSCQLKEKAWRGSYYCVPECHNSSGRQKERRLLGLPKLSFHSFPNDKDMVKIVKIKRDRGVNFDLNKNTKICSEHFTPDDYFPTSDKPNSRRRLKPGVIPSVFKWTTKRFQRHSITSMKALSITEYGTDSHDDYESDLVTNDASGSGSFDDHNQKDVSINDFSLLDEVEQLKLKVSLLQSELEECERTATKSLFRLDNIKVGKILYWVLRLCNTSCFI